jgi:hypothetical protein
MVFGRDREVAAWAERSLPRPLIQEVLGWLPDCGHRDICETDSVI